MKIFRRFVPLVVFVAFLIACTAPIPTPSDSGGKLRVVATTTLVGDVVANIAGDAIELSILLPVGVDPHSFTPTPQDVAKVSQADLVFVNGAGLEEFLAALLESAEVQEKTYAVSEGIQLLQGLSDAHEHETENAQESNHPGDDEHETSVGDPHVWFDPNLVMVWVQNINRVLSEKDAKNAALYQKNAAEYTARLQELDQWIREQVAIIPPEKRQLVTDHLVFGYFAKRYGFTQIGAVVPGFSSLSEPSAQELAALEDTLRKAEVRAIFVGKSVNPNLAQRIADDLGIKLVYVYTGSLSEQGGEADSYLKFMRYNVNAIVNALK